MGVLHLVSTPIGNLEDITARALRILKQASLIAAEDTRHTCKLLDHFGIATPMISYHEHNKLARLDQVLGALAQGDVALVSDAGAPGLNDPGYELVRAALEHGYAVSPVPGPSAPIAALTASGLPTDSFLYLGYLPRKSAQRRRLLEQVGKAPYTMIFLETPHRLLEALVDLHETLGDREICLAREMTKLHEEFFRGSLSEAQAHFSQNAVRGEFTLVVAGYRAPVENWDEARLRQAIHAALEEGASAAQAAARLAAVSGWPRREIYRMATREPS